AHSINWSNVAQGSYSLTAKATATKKNSPNQTGTSSAVNITVNPWVALTAPANGSTFTPGSTIALSATATAPSGYSISKVEFFEGATLVGTSTAAPYSVSLTNVAAGSHSYTAKATDNRGGVTTSSAVSVSVDVSPSVSITAPANNSVFTAPASFTLTATASDS